MNSKAIVAMATVAALIFLSGISAAGERISVSTDKATYLAGEDVTITLTNEYKEDIALTGYRVEDASGEFVFAPPMPCFTEYLAPGESRTYAWNQIDISGRQVVDGYYTVIIDGTGVQIQVVSEPVALTVEDDTLSVGEDVTIALTNVLETPVYVMGGFQVYDVSGEVVYAERAVAFAVPLQPGEALEYVWDQTADSGVQVDEGTYFVCSYGSEVTITIGSAAQGAQAGERPENGPSTPEIVLDPVIGRKPLPVRARPGPVF